MFICETCRVKLGYELPMSGSHGPCESCGKTKECHDIRPWSIPTPPRKVKSKLAKRK
jgi:hypothetical protein